MSIDRTGELRIFIALPADDAKERLRGVYETLNENVRHLKNVAPVNYHITLKFLGAMEPGAFSLLHDDFARLRSAAGPVDYTLRGLGAFPDTRRARVIWCGIDAERERIAALYEMIENLCGNHGFPRDDRAFTPHLTLARARRDARMPAKLADYLVKNRDTVYGSSRFDRLVLFKSDPGRDGPVYTAVSEVRLG